MPERITIQQGRLRLEKNVYIIACSVWPFFSTTLLILFAFRQSGRKHCFAMIFAYFSSIGKVRRKIK